MIGERFCGQMAQHSVENLLDSRIVIGLQRGAGDASVPYRAVDQHRSMLIAPVGVQNNFGVLCGFIERLVPALHIYGVRQTYCHGVVLILK